MDKNYFKNKLPISRRTFNRLSASALLALATPLSFTHAQNLDRRAKRFFAAFNCGGFWLPNWLQNNNGALEFGSSVKSLEKYRNNLLALSGINNVAAGNKGERHARGILSFLTGHDLTHNGTDEGSGFSQDISIDQMLAENIGTHTPFKSLEVGFRVNEHLHPRNRMVYPAPGKPVYPICDPGKLFNLLFNASSSTNTAVSSARRSEIQLLKKQVSIESREDFERHLEEINNLQARLNTSCNELRAPGNFSVEEEATILGDLMGYALRCGYTNVVTFQSTEAASTYLWEWMPDSPKTHHWHGAVTQMATSLQKWISAIDAYNCGAIERVLYHLDSSPEGDGTMLDHTLGFWGGDIKTPRSHSHNDLHWLVWGGSLPGWQGNRWLDAEGERAHNLHVSILQAFGMPVEKFGNNGGDGPLQTLNKLQAGGES